MEYRTIKGKRHYVFDNVDEWVHYFKEGEIPVLVKDWRLGKEGDWVKTDDGRILQLLKVGTLKHPHDRKNYKYATHWCRTIVGTFLMHKSKFMDSDFSLHPNRYTFSTKNLTTAQRVKTRKTLSKQERFFIAGVFPGLKSPVQALMDAYPKTKDPYQAKMKAAMLLKQERIVRELEKTVLEIAKKIGVDHEYVLQGFKDLHEMSEDEHVKLGALKELGKSIGTTGQPVKQTQTGLLGIFGQVEPDLEQLEDIKQARALIEGKAQEDIEVNNESDGMSQL